MYTRLSQNWVVYSVYRLLVEFHVCYVIMIICVSDIIVYESYYGLQINTLFVIIIFIYDISQEEVKEACDLEVVEEA